MSTETDHTTDDTTRDYDYFDDQCCNEISVIGDKSTVTKNSPGSWASVYGSKWIKLNNTQSITEYQIKITKLTNEFDGLMFIGISSNTIHSTGRYSFYNDNRNFSYRSDGVIYHNSKYFNMVSNGAYKTNDIKLNN
eukprot:971581_1